MADADGANSAYEMIRADDIATGGYFSSPHARRAYAPLTSPQRVKEA